MPFVTWWLVRCVDLCNGLWLLLCGNAICDWMTWKVCKLAMACDRYCALLIEHVIWVADSNYCQDMWAVTESDYSQYCQLHVKYHGQCNYKTTAKYHGQCNNKTTAGHNRTSHTVMFNVLSRYVCSIFLPYQHLHLKSHYIYVMLR